MHKCITCHKGIHQGKSLIAFFDEKTRYLFYFCSWWHVIKWYLKGAAKKERLGLGK